MYHVVFVCKYRKVILEPISEELKQIMIDISKESNFEILEMETRIYEQNMENTKGIFGKVILG